MVRSQKRSKEKENFEGESTRGKQRNTPEHTADVWIECNRGAKKGFGDEDREIFFSNKTKKKQQT